MNNKKIGAEFEVEFCEILKRNGYWVHFLTPDHRGAQPFDILAVKDGVPYAFDCKTSAKKWFKIDRLEDNQIMAFEKWLKCGNETPFIAVKYNDKIFAFPYCEFAFSHGGKINLEDEQYEVYRWK